jgi:hypothetical protein
MKIDSLRERFNALDKKRKELILSRRQIKRTIIQEQIELEKS